MNNLENSKIKESIENLQKIGLSKNEAKVYLSLLSIGETGSGAIISHSLLHPQFVYDAIRELEKVGLVERIRVGKRSKYRAAPPEGLVRAMQSKLMVAESVAENIRKNITVNDVGVLGFYRGREAVALLILDSLKKLNRGDEVLLIGGSPEIFNKLMGLVGLTFENERKDRNTKMRVLYSSGEEQALTLEKKLRTDFESKISKTLLQPNLLTLIFGSTVIFVNELPEFFATIIESAELAKNYTNYFEEIYGQN